MAITEKELIMSQPFNREDQTIWNNIFSNIPEEWTKVPPSESMRDCLKFFQENHVQNVLDLGCGIGIWSMFLSQHQIRVKGVDFSQKAIDYAKLWAEKEQQDIIYDCASITNHRFIEEPFDGILVAKILENISRNELSQVKGQILRNLKPGGVLFGLFNPWMTEQQLAQLEKEDHPTLGITSINYEDTALENLFPTLDLAYFNTYEYGFRGLVWRRD